MMRDKYLAQRLLHGGSSASSASLSFSIALSALTHFQSSASLSRPPLAIPALASLSAYPPVLTRLTTAVACD